MAYTINVLWRSEVFGILHLYLIYVMCFQKLVITPIKKELGLAFKGNQKMVVEALEVIYTISYVLVLLYVHASSTTC